MYFKIGLVLSALLMAGCAKNSQNPEDGVNFHLAVGDTNCLDGMGAKFDGFFSGLGTEADIHSVWTCTTKILQDFSQYTEGARPDGYTAAEIKGFLNKYYFKTGISDDAISSTLKLKQAVVGGVGDFVTRSEVEDLIQAIAVLDSATHAIFPVAKILFTDADLTALESNWLGAHGVMSDVAGRISHVLAQSGQDYAFSDFRALLLAWAAQLNLPTDHLLLKVAGLVPALASGKTVLIAGSASSVSSEEWQPLLSSLASAYSYYRMWTRLTTPGDKLALLAAARLPWLVEGVIGLLDLGAQRHSSKQIALSEIHDFLGGLQDQGFFLKSFTADQATSAIQFMLNKLFATPLAPVDVLTTDTVAEMRSFLSAWNKYDAALVSQDFSSAAEFGAAIRPSGISLSLDSQGRLELPGGHAGVFHEFSAIFAILEWTGQKWGTWPISQAVLDQMVSDCLNVLHSLNLLMSTDATFSKRLMNEPNLFMLSSNGDLILDKAEAFQYGVYALSGYRGKEALDVAASLCAGNVDCISSNLFQNRQTLLANFPNLLGWLNNNSTLWAGFNQNLGKIVGTDQWLQQFVVIHYIETYMFRFDQNRNRFIDLNESLAAFPIFHPILSILLPQNGLTEADAEPMYTFLFKYGTIPTNMSGGALTYYFWSSAPGSWAYSSDRNILAGILASLGALTK